jgi:hypothetical protein
MRNSLWKIAVVALLLAGATVLASTPSRADAFDYLAVKVSYAETIQTEFKGRSKVDAKIKKKTDIDSLGEDGWELVSVVGDGSSFVCFFRRRK